MIKRMMKQGAAQMIVYSYAVLTGVLLLRYPVMMFFYKQPYATPGWVVAAELLTVIAGVVFGKLWKDKAFLTMLVFLALLIGRVLYRSGELAWENRETYIYALWAICGCYGLGGALNERQVQGYLRIFTAAWVFGVTVHASIGLFAAWNQQVIWNCSSGGRWALGVIGGNASDIGQDMRLYLIFYPTISGSLLCISALLGCHGFICSRARTSKVFYAVCVAVQLTAMALTDTRTSNICFALGMGGFVLLWLRNIPSVQIRKRFSGREVAIALLLVIVTIFLLVLLPGILTDLFSQTRTSEIMETKVLAEEIPTNTANVANRGYFGKSALSGRPAIWNRVITFLLDHPKYLLVGTSIIGSKDWINPVPGLSYEVEHAHNCFLQVLLESGIPGLLLIFLFVMFIGVRAFRIMWMSDAAKWIRGIPVIVIAVWIGEMVECVYRFERFILPQCALLFLMMGIIGATGKRNGMTERISRQ